MGTIISIIIFIVVIYVALLFFSAFPGLIVPLIIIGVIYHLIKGAVAEGTKEGNK